MHLSPKNSYLIQDPCKRLPVFELNLREWSRINRFRCGQGRCNYLLHKWGMVQSSICNCGLCDQSMDHIVNNCPLNKFKGGLKRWKRGFINWLRTLNIPI